MAQTLTDLLTHITFSTKERMPSIPEQLRKELHAYVGGIVRKMGGRVLMVNGVSDHIHILVQVPPSIGISDMVRTIKTNSPRWIRERSRNKGFAWQAGYGAFSVSRSNAAAVIKYIADQERHHGHGTFENEFITFLKRHQIDYDEQYIWG